MSSACETENSKLTIPRMQKEREKTQRKGNRDESWGSSRELNTSRSSLVSNDVDLAFSSPSLPRLSQMVDPRWSQGRRGFGIGSALRKGIRLCFRTALKKKKKKSMRSRYRCVFNWKTVYSYSADWAESITAENTRRSNREMKIKVRNTSVDHSPSSSLFLRILRIYPRIFQYQFLFRWSMKEFIFSWILEQFDSDL